MFDIHYISQRTELPLPCWRPLYLTQNPTLAPDIFLHCVVLLTNFYVPNVHNLGNCVLNQCNIFIQVIKDKLSFCIPHPSSGVKNDFLGHTMREKLQTNLREDFQNKNLTNFGFQLNIRGEMGQKEFSRPKLLYG